MMKINWYNNYDEYSSKEFTESAINQSVSKEFIPNFVIEPSIIQKENMDVNQYSVEFESKTQNYCIGLVDMVDSTKISAKIGWARTTRYYQIFLNSMSEILKRFGGFVIKNVGDCLVYYFPESAKKDRKYGFMSCLECSLAMIESNKILNNLLLQEGLPPVNYRVSADYGSVVIMKSNGSSMLDMIGSPVNMCSKINHLANRNGIVIGGDLYELVKDLNEYSFRHVRDVSLGFKFSYPVFSVGRRK